MQRIIIFPLNFLLLLCAVQAQIVETTNFNDTTGLSDQGSTLLDQASVGFSGSSPNITLKTYRLSALIGKGIWDLYLYNSVPAYSINMTDTIVSLGDDVLNQLGGLVNISLSKTGYFANGSDKSLRDIKGGQINFRVGGKVLDAKNRQSTVYNDFLVPVLQSTVDLRYLIPLVEADEKKKKSKESIRKKLLGNLSFRIYGGIMYVLKSDVYDDYFKDERGNLPKHTLVTGNVEFNLFFTNQFFH